MIYNHVLFQPLGKGATIKKHCSKYLKQSKSFFTRDSYYNAQISGSNEPYRVVSDPDRM